LEAIALTDTKQQIEIRSHARATGIVYPTYFAAAILGLLLTSRKLPAGVLASGLAPLLYAAVTILLYRLFHPAQFLLALSEKLETEAD